MKDFETIKNEITKVYKEYFPYSLCDVKEYDNRIYVACYLAQKASECMYGYLINDMFSIQFVVTETADNSLQLINTCKSYLQKPEDRYLAYGRRFLKFRKTTGDIKKVIMAYRKFLEQLKGNLEMDYRAGKIHENHKALLVQKLGL